MAFSSIVSSAVPATAAPADTVLAVVSGPGRGDPVRTIGAAEFRAGWSKVRPPARPDSLTPAGARQFLDLLVGQEALTRMAARERWTWTARDSAGYRALRDRLVVDAMLEEEVAATRREMGPKGDSLDANSLGIAARERAIARLAPAWDDSLLARLARTFDALPRPTSDSSVTAQLRMMGEMPRVDAADLARPVARLAAGDYLVSDLLAGWGRLNPVYRPRIASPAQVRDLVANGLFERTLRRRGDSLGVAGRPAVVERLRLQRTYLDVNRLVEREVQRRIRTDSLTLARYYARTASDWMQPTRVRLLRVEVDGRPEAERMAARLADAAAAESLAATAARVGLQWTVDLAAEQDSALFARAMAAGTGAVLGPDPVGGGWRVARTLAVLPGGRLGLAEVRDLVERRWVDEESERLMRELLARARRGLAVRLDERGLAALVAAGAGPAATGR